MTTSHTNTRTAANSVARNDWLAAGWRSLGGRRAPVAAIAAGAALNWGWPVVAGIAPVLLSALPCVVICGLGLGMNRMLGRSGMTPLSRPPQDPGMKARR